MIILDVSGHQKFLISRREISSNSWSNLFLRSGNIYPETVTNSRCQVEPSFCQISNNLPSTFAYLITLLNISLPNSLTPPPMIYSFISLGAKSNKRIPVEHIDPGISRMSLQEFLFCTPSIFI